MKIKKLLLFLSICTLTVTCIRADLTISAARFVQVPWLYLGTTTGGLSVKIDYQGAGQYEFTTGLIGGDYSLFSSSPGQEFTPLEAGNRANDLVPGTSIQRFSLNETKYFAYWEQVFAYEPAPAPVSADNYGWVSLTYTPSGLVITDSATAIGGGIIVGTYTQIPEPATVLLFGLGGIGAWLLRRNGRAPAEPF